MPANHRYSIRSALKVCVSTVLACLALTACGSFKSSSTSAINPVNWLTPYKVDVIQGNFVSKEQIDLLKVGMPRAQVKDLLGTPLVASVFHADRWDYVFTLKRQGVESQSYRYTVLFKNDLLESFSGDSMPSESEFIAKLDNKRKLGKVPPLEATEAQLKAAEKSSKPETAVSNAAASLPTGASATVYPPLESPRQ